MLIPNYAARQTDAISFTKPFITPYTFRSTEEQRSGEGDNVESSANSGS